MRASGRPSHHDIRPLRNRRIHGDAQVREGAEKRSPGGQKMVGPLNVHAFKMADTSGMKEFMNGGVATQIPHLIEPPSRLVNVRFGQDSPPAQPRVHPSPHRPVPPNGGGSL